MKLTRSVFISVIIVLNIALDQISKFIVRSEVITHKETEIIGEYFILTNVENPGAFLGFGSDLNPTLKVILLLIVPILVLLYVLFYLFNNKKLDKPSVIGFACILGGGIANIFDRIVYGSVTDFLHIDLGGVFKTGIFNVADMSVMLGMGLLIFASFRMGKSNPIDN